MKRRSLIVYSRRPKWMILESVDRISVLPDSILGIILSFLPTKNAVSTSLLSKRWKLVWTMVHNLDLCYDGCRGLQAERDDIRFVGFVDHVLNHHDAGWLNKFRLVWTPRCISSHATSWIHTAISKNVHELVLRLEAHTVVMPLSVFRCDTLRILKLDGGISVSESLAACLPNLETLMLESIHFQSEEAFEMLIRGCPVLINLCIAIPYDMLYEFYQDVDFTYVISSTSLRHLEVDIRHECVPLYINLELEAPSLEYLSLYGFIPVFRVKTILRSLVEAKLKVELGDWDFSVLGGWNCSDVNMCNSVVEAVRVFDCAKALHLSEDIIWALCYASIRLSTKFKRLVKLEAVTYSCACSSLRDFIECSDNLEVLSVYQYNSCSGEIEFDSKWIAPVQVPRCLSNSLKKVVLKGYYGLEIEREMVRYMLKHGKALEDMKISFAIDSDNEKVKLVQDIFQLSKKLSSKAPACEVRFSGETSKCNIQLL